MSDDPTPILQTQIERACRRIRQIATIPDPHVAFTLLRFCGGAALVTHLMRSVGPHVLFSLVDTATMDAFTDIAMSGSLSDQIRTLISLPQRHGGLGLRLAALHAPAAIIGACYSSQCVAPSLVPAAALELLSPIADYDRLTTSLSAAGPLAPFPTALAPALAHFQGPHAERVKLQRIVSREIEKARHETLFLSVDAEMQARINSTSAPHSGAFLSLPHPDDEPQSLWLDPASFRVVIKYRVGLPLDDEPRQCPSCRVHVADVRGVHLLSCPHTGARTELHHRGLRDPIFEVCSAACLNPQREPMIPGTTRRGDVLLRRAEIHEVLDTAVVNALAPTNLPHAIAQQGGAATEYERVKRTNYDGICRAAGLLFVPVIADSFGAWGASALPLLRSIARRLGERTNLAPSRHIPRLMRLLGVRFQRQVARCLARAPRPLLAE